MEQSEILCRLCSKEKKPLVGILDNNPLNIREKMAKLLNIKVTTESSLPKKICLECLTKLNTLSEFYNFSHENQYILRLLFNEKSEENSSKINVETQTENTSEDVKNEQQFIIIEEMTSNSDNQLKFEFEEELMEIENEDKSRVENRVRRKFDRFDCYLCNQQLPGNLQFIQHFNTAHKNQEIKYKCHFCNNFVKKYRSFTRHIESHVSEKRFVCDICELKFSQKITLQNHLTSHFTLKKFKCGECNLSFKQNSSLFKHRRQKHSKDVPFCKICSRNFVNNETFQQHLKSKHNQGEKNIACEDCERKFASKSALSYHRMSIHSRKEAGEVEIKCEKCEEKFKNQITLSRHLKKCGK